MINLCIDILIEISLHSRVITSIYYYKMKSLICMNHKLYSQGVGKDICDETWICTFKTKEWELFLCKRELKIKDSIGKCVVQSYEWGGIDLGYISHSFQSIHDLGINYQETKSKLFGRLDRTIAEICMTFIEMFQLDQRVYFTTLNLDLIVIAKAIYQDTVNLEFNLPQASRKCIVIFKPLIFPDSFFITWNCESISAFS